MKKIFLMLIILGVGYMISIFLAPSYADKIGDFLGIKSFNEKVRNNGGDVNRVFTNIPTTEELEKGYNDVVKKAKNFSNNVSNGIDKTKETIDDIRVTLSGAEDTIKRAKETYHKVKDTYDKTIKTAEEFKKTYDDIEKMGNAIQNVVDTGAIKGN